MRLNLQRHHCIRFEISSEFTVSTDRDAEIQSAMHQTATHTHDLHDGDEQVRIALFGSRSRVAGITHQILGNLIRRQPEGDPSYRLLIISHRVPASPKLPPPPAWIRPVSVLVETASQLFGSLRVDCTATFQYDQTVGYKSRVPFPIQLIVQDATEGITHIDGAQFSRRDHNGIQYQIEVIDPADSTNLLHLVDFEFILNLSRGSVRELFGKARSISDRLLVRPEGG